MMPVRVIIRSSRSWFCSCSVVGHVSDIDKIFFAVYIFFSLFLSPPISTLLSPTLNSSLPTSLTHAMVVKTEGHTIHIAGFLSRVLENA